MNMGMDKNFISYFVFSWLNLSLCCSLNSGSKVATAAVAVNLESSTVKCKATPTSGNTAHGSQGEWEKSPIHGDKKVGWMSTEDICPNSPPTTP